MADECTDTATIEELSIFCRWEENGSPIEHFMEILPLKRCDAESIYSTLIKWLKKKGVQCRKMVGMGFDGASTFTGKRSGVQARLKKHAPHAILVHCYCHKLQLAIVQAASVEVLYHFSKRCENLKEVIDLPELKITKPSDTRWLAHERCVSTVKRCYGANVSMLEQIYEEYHEHEALGLSKILGSSTLFTRLRPSKSVKVE